MPNDSPPPAASRPPLLRNWLTLAGAVIALGSLFSFLLLIILDALAPSSNPYLGILTYLVAPGFLALGLVLVTLGAFIRWRKLRRSGGSELGLKIDLTRPRDRKLMGGFLLGAVAFLLVSALGSYQTYHYTESVQFCGQACHTVMKPELITYQHSPHARVSCVECHIGSGAEWYVRSKISGTYQVYSVMADKFPRPIPTPIKNLRPAQETCEQCHWPQKFVGNLDRTYSYFLGDETNTPFTVRMLMKVGGGDPARGPVGGIHWHMNIANRVDYIATDESRQQIPWVRLTDSQGRMTEFRTPGFTNELSAHKIRTMDCMDCHNRPSHRYETPDDAVNLAMDLGRIDRSMPWIKTNAIFALTRSYTNEAEAKRSIATALSQRYTGDTRVKGAIDAVQQIYTNNFFPDMRAHWKAYPDNIGHKEWPGCFRCHDGKHKTADGRRSIKADDCNSCHTILAQGAGPQLEQLTPTGQKFIHPGDPLDSGSLCTECHDGTF
jgi:nitrate/TMAO reductase-like tetraheme cytochrome c subunit